MKSQEIEVVNKLGLHARAAATLVKLCNDFQASIHISKGPQQASCKNIMDVLMLAATQGSLLILKTDGSDEEDALEAVAKLFADRFYESE